MLVTRKNHIKIESLKLKNDISNVFKLGKSRSFDGIVIKVVENSIGSTRFCIIPSHGFGNAVERNTLKRRIRSIFRDLCVYFDSSYDIVVIIKKTEKNISFKDLLFKIEKVLKKLTIIDKKETAHL